MTKSHVALILAAALVPGSAAAQGWEPAAGTPRDNFSLYRGSEARLSYGQVRDGSSPASDEIALDTSSTFWLAPFLGAQVDAGLRWLDLDEAGLGLGVHLHLMADDGSRFGAYYLPTFVDEDDFGDDRFDNYGIEGMFEAMPGLSIEARLGRFDGAVEAPYLGASGYYALSPEIMLTADFQHTRADRTLAGRDDVNFTDMLVGAEYYMPGSDIRLSGGIGLLAQSGDVDETDLRIEFGATLFAFGAPATTARSRSFGQQRLPGVF